MASSASNSGIKVSGNGSVCTFEGSPAQAILVGNVLMPDSGVHYVEYEVVEARYVVHCAGFRTLGM